MWAASESFIHTGTYWLTIRLRNVRNTRSAMIVPTVEATPRSSDRSSRIRTRMDSPEENPPYTFHRPILDDAIYRCRAENLTLRMSRFSPCEEDHFGPVISTVFSARFSERLLRSFRRSLRGRIEERRFAGHEPLHSVDRRVLVRRVCPGSVAQAHRHPWQLEVFIEGEGGHRAPARRPDLRLFAVRLDRLDRRLRDPRTGVNLRVGLVREHRLRAAVFDVPRVHAADVHGRLEQVFQEELILRQIELELRRPFLLKPGGRVERLREGLHHPGIELRRRDDVVPDAVDGGTLVPVDQGVECLQEAPNRGPDPHRIRAVD